MTLYDFIRESNRIEGIHEVREGEVQAAEDFLRRRAVSTTNLVDLVRAFQPDAVLRDRVGLNVYVGTRVSPPGGPEIATYLADICRRISTPGEWQLNTYEIHQEYEYLHPFSDGNGRSGRMIWLWQKWQIVPEVPSLGFLHSWYYESLEHHDLRS